MNQNDPAIDFSPVSNGKKTLSIEDCVHLIPAMAHSNGLDGCLKHVNNLWLEKLGYARHEVIGRRLTDFLTPTSRILAETHVMPTFVHSGRYDNVEYQMVKKSGDIIEVRMSEVLDRDARGDPLSLAIIEDVTAQKASERKSLETEARYRGVVEDQNELVALVSPEFAILFVNAAYARHHGVDPSEMIGCNALDFVPIQHHDRVSQHLNKTIASNGTLQDTNEVVLPDGRIRRVSWSNRAIRDRAGNVTAIHSVGRDVDDDRQVELLLAESETRYRMLAEHSTDMVFQFDVNLVRKYVSPACRDILGVNPEDLIDRQALFAVHPDDIDEIRTSFKEIAEGRRERGSFSHRIRHKDGRWLWVEAAVRATRNPNTGVSTGLIGALRDISAKKAIEAKLEKATRRLEILAREDGLTRLHNRRALDEMLAREVKIARRGSSTLSVLMVDVDYFKAYNDRYGHQAGDVALRRVAHAIRSSIRRPADFAARYGGEEFVIILPDTEQLGATKVADAIRSKVEALQLEHAESHLKLVTVSIGVASVSNATVGDVRKEVILKRADEAVYAAKKAGRNKTVAWIK